MHYPVFVYACANAIHFFNCWLYREHMKLHFGLYYWKKFVFFLLTVN